MNKEEIINEVMGSFKITVDTKGLKKFEKYIDSIEQENKDLKEKIEIENHHKLIEDYQILYLKNKELQEKNEFLMKRDNKCQILEQRIKEAKDYLEYYLLDNLRYEESKKEFKRLLDILKEVE